MPIQGRLDRKLRFRIQASSCRLRVGIVTDRLVANGYPAADILNLGDDRNPSWDEIVQEMILDMGTPHVLLAGMVNIHTHQAEALLDFFDEAETAELLLEHAAS